MDQLLFHLASSDRIDLIENEPYSSRFESEAKVIEQLKQIENIVQAIEIKKVVEELNLPFFIRGSAGGSLILYLLCFTDIDPVKHNITFERFLNEFRTSLGDIDFDLPRQMREQVMLRVKERFNKPKDTFGIICTRVYYKARSALREAIRQVCRYRRFIPKEVLNDREQLDIFLRTVCFTDPEKVYNKAKTIEGSFHHYSTHVGGITKIKPDDKIITNTNRYNPSHEQLPLICADKNDIDKDKRFKIDLLSNSGLDVIYNIYGKIELNESKFPLDNEVFDMIGEGNTIGIVYGESPLVITTFQKYHSKYGLKKIEDIAKCLSMIRPMCRQDNKDSDLIFDDDWITTLSDILQVNYSEADCIRRKLSKDDSDTKSKLLTKISTKRLKQLMQIKYYGFCKAHAMNYANLVYCQAYAKYYKRNDFYCAVLNTINGRIYDDWVYFYSALRSGCKIRAHKAGDTYVIKNGYIQPKNGYQMLLRPLSPLQEISQFNGLTRLQGLDKLHLIACSRHYKDVVFSTELQAGELVNVVTYI
jgi:DNA polymerase III subunit alpha